MDRSTIGSASSSLRDSVVLPAPEGEDSTSINPRRAIMACSWPAAVTIGRARGSAPLHAPARGGGSGWGRPVRIRAWSACPLFQILHLLAELLHDAFEVQTNIGQQHVVRLGAERVGFAI